MRKFTLMIVAAGVVFSGLIALAQDKTDKKPAPTPEEMMAAMAKAAAVGPEHKKLEAMAGKFTADVTLLMAPDAPPENSKGTSNNEMVMGGRYLKCDFAGSMMGQAFKGVAIMGYDNVKKKYTAFWMDDMSTQMMLSDGDADPAGKVITSVCQVDCPTDNSKKTMKQVWTIQDNDHHTYEMYEVVDGKDVKGLTIKYTRVKE